MNRRAEVLVGLCLVGCGTAFQGAGAGLGVPVADMRPDDRVLIADMSTVNAVASSFERVYVAYPSAVGVWLPGQRSWLPPLEAPEFEALARVFTGVVDPLDQSLWLADETTLWHLDQMTGRWQRYGVPDRVRGLGIDPTTPEGIWVSTTSGWYIQARVGGMRPARPGPNLRPAPDLEDAFEAVPSLRSAAAIIGSGPGLRPGRLTAAAPDLLTGGWFIGTELRGLLYFAPGDIDGEPLRQGLLGDQIGALSAMNGGVWVASDDQLDGRPMSLGFLSSDLSRTTTVRGDAVFGLGVGAVREILTDQKTLWLGSDQGVVKIALSDQKLSRWTTADGLTDPHVLALESWRGGVAVGMERGFVMIDAGGVVTRPVDPVLDAVYDLYAAGDTLWLGTDRGLAFMTSDDGVLRPAAGWPLAIVGAETVIGVGVVGDTLVAITRSRMVSRNPVGGAWQFGRELGSLIGPLGAFDFTAAGVWLGGSRGAALILPGQGRIALLTVGEDLPARVTAIATGDGYLWIGTSRGLVRVRVQQ